MIKMCIGLHLKYPLFVPILMKLEFSQQIFEKFTSIKFHENPSRWRPSCSMRTDGQT